MVKITWDKGFQSYHFANIFHEILGNLLLLFFVLWLMIIYPCIIIPELFLIQVFKFLRSYDRHTKLYRIKHGIIIILKQGTVIRKCHQTCDLPGFFTSDQGISYLKTVVIRIHTVNGDLALP